MYIVAYLPRKSSGNRGIPEGHRRDTGGTPEGHRRDTGTYIQALRSALCPMPATLSHACHVKAAETKRHRRVTGGTPGRTSDPLAVDIVLRLLCKRGGDQGTSEGHRRDTGGTPGRTSDPLAIYFVPRLPRKSGGNQGTLEGRQGVYPTPWQCTWSHAYHVKEAETKGHRRDTRVTPGPTSGFWACILFHACQSKAAETKDPGGTSGRTSDPPWHCTLFHACHAKAAEKRRRPRDTGGTPGRTSDPLAVQIIPRLPRKSGGNRGTPEGRQGRAYIRPLGSIRCPTPATQKWRKLRGTGGTPEGRDTGRRDTGGRDTGGTPGRASDPLAVLIACHAKAAETKDYQRDSRAYIRAPWQCTLSHTCHAKAAETKGPEGRQSVHPTP